MEQKAIYLRFFFYIQAQTKETIETIISLVFLINGIRYQKRKQFSPMDVPEYDMVNNKTLSLIELKKKKKIHL